MVLSSTAQEGLVEVKGRWRVKEMEKMKSRPLNSCSMKGT